MKKVFIISTILLIVVLIFLGIANFAFPKEKKGAAQIVNSPAQNPRLDKSDARQDPSEDVSLEGGVAQQNDPVVAERKNEVIIPVSKRKVIAPVIDRDAEKIRFYDKDTGNVVDIPIIGGGERVFSDVRLNGLVYATWAPDAQRVLTKFINDGGRVKIYSFDHRTGRGTQLKSGVYRVEWTPVGDQILYTFVDGNSQRASLNIADPDGTNWRILADNVTPKTRFVGIPQSSRVAFWPQPDALTKTELKVVSLLDAQPQIRTIFSGHYNADFLFSPDGERILVSSTQERGSSARMIGVANSDGSDYRNLHIPTNVNKCVWASNSRIVYCAFPTGDRDTFWKIDITTNKKERIIDLNNVVASSTRYQAFDMFLSPDGQSLFFVNAIDGRLYRISL